MHSADSFLEAVRSRGIETDCVRDAAHEAFHAIRADIDPPWGRNRVHEALAATYPGALLWLEEVRARIVEQRVCEALGVDVGPIDGWLLTSTFEAMKRGLPCCSPEDTLPLLDKVAADFGIDTYIEVLLELEAI